MIKNAGADIHRLAEKRSAPLVGSFSLLMSGSALTLHLHTPDLVPSSGIFVAAPLLVGFGNYGRNRKMPASCIHGNKRQVGRAHVLAAVEHITFHPNLYSDFHRGAV